MDFESFLNIERRIENDISKNFKNLTFVIIGIRF